MPMPVHVSSEAVHAAIPAFTAAQIAVILRQHGWLAPQHDIESDAAMHAWLARASELLSPHAADDAARAGLLALIFSYDAPALLGDPASHAVLVREGARDVIRALANHVFDASEIDSDRFKQMIDAMKQALPHRSRALFHPVRLVLAGRVGEGELDRVILLLDSAAKLDFAARVKGTRQRMSEFCASLD